jgi:hypothetical protein
LYVTHLPSAVGLAARPAPRYPSVRRLHGEDGDGQEQDFFSIHPDRPSPGKDLVTFKVSDDLLKGKVSPLDKLFKGKYADMRVGQHIALEYHRDEKTGELVADRYHVMEVRPKEKKPAR